MNDHNKEMIMELISGKMSEATFRKKYPLRPGSENRDVLEGLRRGLKEKDSGKIEYLMMLGSYFEVFSQSYVDVLADLLVQNWHCKHEDIARILGTLKSIRSIESLRAAASTQFAYLSHDDSYALAVKCLHGLKNIGTSEARENIRAISLNDPRPAVRREAKYRLSKNSK